MLVVQTNPIMEREFLSLKYILPIHSKPHNWPAFPHSFISYLLITTATQPVSLPSLPTSNTAAALLIVLPGLLSAWDTEGKPWKMTQSPSKSGSSLQPPFLLLPMLPNIAWSGSTPLLPPPRCTQHVLVSILLLTWIPYLECPFSFSPTAGPGSSLESPLYMWTPRGNWANWSVSCAITHFVQTRNTVRPSIWGDPLHVPALRQRWKLPLSSRGNRETDVPDTMIRSVCTKCSEHKRRNSWMCVRACMHVCVHVCAHECACVRGWDMARKRFIYNYSFQWVLKDE